MRHSSASRFFAAILIGLLVHAPAVYASCTRQSGPTGPPFSQALVYDYTFDDTNCSAWQVSGSIYGPGGNGYVIFDAPGELYQDIVVDTSFSSYALSFDVTIEGSSPGLEKLRIEVDGVQLEELNGNSSSGRYDYDPIGDYDNSTVRIRIYRPYTSFPGDTVFTVNWVEMWGRF